MTEAEEDKLAQAFLDTVTEMEVARRQIHRSAQRLLQLAEQLPPRLGSGVLIRDLMQGVSKLSAKFDLVALYRAFDA